MGRFLASRSTTRALILLGLSILLSACSSLPKKSESKSLDPPEILSTLPLQGDLPIYSQEKAERLSNHFMQVAFEREFQEQGKTLVRWERPIAVEFIGPMPEGLKDRFEQSSRIISALTGIPIRKGSDANIRIYHRQNALLNEKIYNTFKDGSIPNEMVIGRCRSIAQISSGSQIVHIDIFIDATLSKEDKEICLTEEMAQGMGLFADIEWKDGSLFNEINHYSNLTYDDAILLQTLYHHTINSGMDREKARDRAGKIMERLLKRYSRLKPILQ